jgi:hypothetical protein
MFGFNLIVFGIIAIAVFFLLVAVFQWLWNTTMPEAFGLKDIRYWVAFRLLLIAAFLTSGGFAKAPQHASQAPAADTRHVA